MRSDVLVSTELVRLLYSNRLKRVHRSGEQSFFRRKRQKRSGARGRSGPFNLRHPASQRLCHEMLQFSATPVHEKAKFRVQQRTRDFLLMPHGIFRLASLAQDDNMALTLYIIPPSRMARWTSPGWPGGMAAPPVPRPPMPPEAVVEAVISVVVPPVTVPSSV